VKTIRREGTPKRVHHIELFLDGEVQEALNQRFGIGSDLSPDDPALPWKRQIALQRFLGYDYVRVGVDGLALPVHFVRSEDAAALSRSGGRTWINERSGPIQNWEDFEKYPWPTPQTFRTATLEWYNRNLPDDMVIIGSPFGHFDEFLCWLFGYEYLCFALFEQRDLVLAVKQKLEETYEMVLRLILQFDRVRLTWASDDMGFRNGLLLGPRETRELVLPGHTRMAEISHAAGRPYLLHTCGDMSAIMEDLIEDVKIDAKHSFEDTIEDVRDTKRQYGDRLTLLGGIDVDFLCRADEQAIRKRVRDTIDACQPSGGWCLGSGNSVTNYIPVDNYLAMLDEGRRYGR
jgi:uroporphyrinogen decarboxylase